MTQSCRPAASVNALSVEIEMDRRGAAEMAAERGGGRAAASIWLVAAPSAPLHDDLVMACAVIRPEGPIEKTTPTESSAPDARAAVGLPTTTARHSESRQCRLRFIKIFA